MSQYITLLGAQDVAHASQAMRAAAETMLRAASQLSDTLERHRLFLDEWLIKFEAILTENKP